MKKIFITVCAVSALIFSSCGTIQSGISGALYTDVKSPVAVTSNSGSSKVGTSNASMIIGIATGDASIEAAAKSAGITKIHHVDSHATNILGVYGKYVITVYGE
ncbi:TRL-like family protein [Bacteroides sp. 51]|uniref:TRL-like family protein n=1 Tax=Bacteroides sp. 51 TaxID=2302938 RepID=UPI0013D3F9EE|nr:TRL-like family protein [Bacteroides sp. 51]NDV80519.1 hypothetical protein [Bacteroides sp. 51]